MISSKLLRGTFRGDCVIKIQNIISVWDALDCEASLEDLVDAISRKYHIVNDAHLYYAVKRVIDSNKSLFDNKGQVGLSHIDNDLSKAVTFDKFELAYSKFIDQAERNVKTQKSEGSKTPYGFDFASKQNFICGGAFSQHFGQGAASKTPYISWHVVSIYYVVESSKIVLGIEKSRYSHLDKMSSAIRVEEIGKKGRDVAIFYQCDKGNIDYLELYEKFITVSSEVMKLGL